MSDSAVPKPLYGRLNPWLGAFIAASLVFAGMLAIDAAERQNAMQEQRIHVMEQLSTLRARLEAAANTPVAASRAMAVIYAAHPDLPQHEFTRLAEQVKASSPAILSIALIRDTIVCCVYPREGNEKLVGLDFRNSPAQWAAYQRMVAARQTAITGPLKWAGGGDAIAVHTPVYRADAVSGTGRFIGAIEATVPFDVLLRKAGLPDIEKSLHVAIRDGEGGSGEIYYGAAATFAAQPVTQQIALPGGSWQVAAYPRGGWGANLPALGGTRLLGGLLGLLAAMSAYLLALHLWRRDENERRLHESEAGLIQRSAELVHQNAVLEMINHNAELPDILEMLAQLVEIHHPEMLCAILLLDQDGKHLRHGAAPNLPDFYNQAVDGLAIGEGVGSCGTAAYRGERVIVEDIRAHPYWGNGRELALRANLQSCWSQPIKDHGGQVLGTFAVYHRHPAIPQPAEIMLIESYAALAALAIERTRTAEALHLHDAALNFAANAIIITDLQGGIVWANHAFSELTGYGAAEAIGQHCGELVKSGHHDQRSYDEMLQTLLCGKTWHGEMVCRRKDGTLYNDETTITPVRDQNGEITHFIALKRDITARKISEEYLKNLAFYDSLTQLPNRRLLVDRLGQAMAISKRSGQYGALMFLDLDNFKPLNDKHGHDVGDLLLMRAAQRIVNCVREEDTVARFGGDEFVVMLKELDADKAVSTTLVNTVAEKVRAALAEPYQLELLQEEDGRSVIEYRCSSSIGIVLFVGHESDKEDILKCADIAMYQAKAAGCNTVRFYYPDKLLRVVR